MLKHQFFPTFAFAMNNSFSIPWFIAVLFFVSATACEYVVVPMTVDCTQSDLAIEVASVTGTLCGSKDGSVTVNATGGDGNYQYKVEGGTYQASNVLSGLAPGIYNVFVMDNIGCEATVSAQVAATDGVNITNIVVVDAGCGSANGSITISVDSTDPNIMYQLNGGAFGNTATFTGLAPGDYTIGVKDTGGCINTATAKITSGIPFATIKALMDANCNLAGCHVAGARAPDLTIDANIVTWADKIKTLTANKRMPKRSSGKSLTPQEIADIACWVDDGAPLN